MTTYVRLNRLDDVQISHVADNYGVDIHGNIINFKTGKILKYTRNYSNYTYSLKLNGKYGDKVTVLRERVVFFASKFFSSNDVNNLSYDC